MVDASGRGSRSPAWLEELGYSRPAEEKVRIGMGYTSCYYRRHPDHIPGLNGIVLLATPPDKRLGVMLAQDGNRWVVTVGGYLGDHAPTDFQGFLEAARRLPVPDIYDVIKNAEPCGQPVAYKFPANLRHCYEKLARFPKGYLVLGDALCSFNPIYGQGMTVAALEAEALGACLANGRNHLAKHFLAKASKIIDVSWSAATDNVGVTGYRVVRHWFVSSTGTLASCILRPITMPRSPTPSLRSSIWSPHRPASCSRRSSGE